MKRPFTDTWPEPLTEGQKLMRSYGETPDSMRHHKLRDIAAQAKRDRRIARNVSNEAAQGNWPEGIYKAGGDWMAECKVCGGEYDLPCDLHEFDPNMSYCGRRESCCP